MANNNNRTGNNNMNTQPSILRKKHEVQRLRSKLKKKTAEEISKVTGGIDLPPGFKLPF